MRVIIENTVCLNTGDAAILLAIRQILRRTFGPAVTLSVFDSQPRVAARLYPGNLYPDLEFHHLISESVLKQKYDRSRVKNGLKTVYNKALLYALSKYGRASFIDGRLYSREQRTAIEAYRDADLVITTGGTYLVENYNLERRLNQFEFDTKLGKPPIFFTQSMGPFDKPVNRRRLQPILQKSPLILLRDEKSRGHLKGLLDAPGRCHVVADSVFALADTDRIARLRTAGPPHSGRVAVSVRHWNYVEGGDSGMRRYVDSVRAMVERLVLDYGKEVVFLSTCQGVPEYAHDDSRTANAIVAELDPAIRGRVSVDPGFHRPEELMEKAKGFDFVVSTRMHMMIMSLCVGTPVLPIAYEFKTRELAKRVGLSDVLLNIDTMTAEDSVARLKRFVGDLDTYRAASLEAVISENASALSAGDLLRGAVPTASTQMGREIAGAVQKGLA